MLKERPATGFFRDVNVQAMDRTFDAMGKLFGTTAQAVGKLLIAAEPVAGMVAGLVLGFDHLVLALPKWFLTDFMKVAATFMLIKTVLPVLVGEMTALNVEFAAHRCCDCAVDANHRGYAQGNRSRTHRAESRVSGKRKNRCGAL